MSVSPIPEGAQIITPYVLTMDVRGLIAFLRATFDATVGEQHEAEDGTIRHAEAQIGTSKLMMGTPMDASAVTNSMFYVYVQDCDATFAKALEAGAETVREPRTEFYGDRSGGVKGPCGNQWWMATHVEDVSPEEMARRAAEAMAAEDASA